MTNTTQSQRPLDKKNQDRLKFMDSKIFWFLIVLILFSLPLIYSFKKIKNTPIQELPVYGQIDEFHLLNQFGREISSKDFAGSVLLVNFIFTRCPDTCPLITQQMSKVQRRLKGTAKSVQLLSISVDPEYDQPEVLKRYADHYSADKNLWTFATGNPEEVQNLVVNQFKMALDRSQPENQKKAEMAHGDHHQHMNHDSMPMENNKSEEMMEITHSENFVLVDQVGQIRGFRQLKTDEDINGVVRDLAILVNSKPPQRKADSEELPITAPAR